jgi:3-dehydroquinate dehydratase type I
MICVSLADTTLERTLALLENIPFAEIRVDLMHLSLPEITRLFSAPCRLIATCRPGAFPDADRKAMLLAAIDAGASYVDVEVDSDVAYRTDIVERAHTRGCKVILSYHDYERTPGREELVTIVDRCFSTGADLCKIACTVVFEKDGARLLGLLDDVRQIVVVGMGERGRVVRVAAPLLGSPFTFASIREGKETAKGQIDRQRLAGLIDALQFHKEMGGQL